MSRVFDGKERALQTFPNDRESAADLLLDYLDINIDEFFFNEGMSPEAYIFGNEYGSGSK